MPNDEAVPASSISWTTGPKGRAVQVIANPLTINGEGGSAPQEDVPGWTGASGVPEARIRAHLLHHDLHGPGRRFNLTPTSTSTNGLMWHRFEKHAKAAIIKKKRQLYYMTKVKYDDTTKDNRYKDVAKTVTMKVYDLKTNKAIEGTDSKEDTFTNF
jgi:hypothetical protein